MNVLPIPCLIQLVTEAYRRADATFHDLLAITSQERTAEPGECVTAVRTMEELNPLLPTITVDSHESRCGLADRLRQNDLFEIKEEALEVGDILIAGLIAERKTGADFIASLEDGRLFRQLLMMRRLHYKRALIIEGPVPYSSRMPERAVFGARVRISGSLQVPSFTTNDLTGTVRLVERLALQLYCLTSPHFPPRATDPTAGFEFHQVYVPAGVPGIGLARAKALLRHFGSLQRIFCAPETELRQVPGIGEFHARRITSLARFGDRA